MKISKFATLMLCGLVIAASAIGCKKKPGYLTPLPGQPGATVGEATPGNPLGDDPNSRGILSADTTGGFPLNEVGAHAGWKEDPETLKAQTVYFDFDSSSVKASEQSKVSAVADFLKGNTAAAVRVEGHCDERGTEGYNQSLGERRALAVREELVRMGIAPTRVDTTSYGEDRPAVVGSDESAYRMNRRGEFIVLTPP